MHYNDDEVREMLRKRALDAGSQKALAEQWGVSASLISDVLNCRADPSRAILEPLGLKRVVLYEKSK